MAQPSLLILTRGSINYGILSATNNLVIISAMVSSSLQAGFKNPDTKVDDLKKAIHYLENEPYIHRSLMTMAEQSASVYLMTEGLATEVFDDEEVRFHEPHMKDDCDQLKELADLVYVCYQFAASQDLDEAFRRVHESNMSSLTSLANLSTVLTAVLKGPNYKEPICKIDYRMTTTYFARDVSILDG